MQSSYTDASGDEGLDLVSGMKLATGVDDAEPFGSIPVDVEVEPHVEELLAVVEADIVLELAADGASAASSSSEAVRIIVEFPQGRICDYESHSDCYARCSCHGRSTCFRVRT